MNRALFHPSRKQKMLSELDTRIIGRKNETALEKKLENDMFEKKKTLCTRLLSSDIQCHVVLLAL
jgi:hypothetical protein